MIGGAQTRPVKSLITVWNPWSTYHKRLWLTSSIVVGWHRVCRLSLINIEMIQFSISYWRSNSCSFHRFFLICLYTDFSPAFLLPLFSIICWPTLFLLSYVSFRETIALVLGRFRLMENQTDSFTSDECSAMNSIAETCWKDGNEEPWSSKIDRKRKTTSCLIL